MHSVWVRSTNIWGPQAAYGPYHAALRFFEKNPLESEVTVTDSGFVLIARRAERGADEDGATVVLFEPDVFREKAKEERNGYQIRWWSEELASYVLPESDLIEYAREYFERAYQVNLVQVRQVRPANASDVGRDQIYDEFEMWFAEYLDACDWLNWEGGSLCMRDEMSAESRSLLAALIDSVLVRDVDFSGAAWQPTGVVRTITREEVRNAG